MTRCTGHCCKEFELPLSPTELKDRADKIRDGEQIRDMVIYVGEKVGSSTKNPESSLRHYYGCKNLQTDGNCGIYSDRPEMCRDYPYGRECGYTECTMQEATQ